MLTRKFVRVGFSKFSLCARWLGLWSDYNILVFFGGVHRLYAGQRNRAIFALRECELIFAVEHIGLIELKYVINKVW